MEEKYFIIMITRCLLIQLLLVVAAQPGKRALLYCPITCTCVMDDIVEDNRATCDIDNSTVDMSWYMRGGNYLTLDIVCANAVENSEYNCNDWPLFNITVREPSSHLTVMGCAPSIMRCANGMLVTAKNFTIINTTMMAGTYRSEDLMDFDHVHEADLTLRDQDTVLPAVVANTISTLTFLEVVGGNLEFTPNSFNHANLFRLKLDLNNIKVLPSDSFNGLSKLKHLIIQHNSFEHLGPHALRGLDALQLINLTNNTLMTIDPIAFSSTKELDTLLINKNRLKLIPNGLFTDLNKLRKLRITMNQVEMTLDTHAFANLPPSLGAIEVIYNKLEYLPEHVFNGSIYIEYLNFNKNNIKTLPPNIFSTMTNLNFVEFEENKIENLPEELFYKKERLENVALSYNHIETLRGKIFADNPNLKGVGLSHNRLAHIDRDIFKGTNLTSLHLNSNKLQRIIGNTTLEWQTQLLNLSHNELSVFEEWFVEIQSLQNLDLSGNKLKIIKESHMYRFNSKVTIDLRNNSITEIVRDTSDPPVNVTPGDVTLYLSNNPLQCDCVVTTLLKEWHKYGILADYEDITCDNEGKLSKLDVYIQCNKTYALVALVGSSTVGALVIIVILLTVFNQRRKIWINVRNLFKSNNSEDIFKKGDDNTSFEMKEEVKLYDLFISFAHQDADIVADKLLPILENDFKLKVCVHYRDWVVGDLIPVQIKESVESSSMTMIIVSKYFLESEWSSLEFRAAHELSIADGKPRVIIVLLNESITRHDNLDGDLKAYIDMNTYLVWDDTYFWDKLQKILPKIRNIKQKKSIFK